MVNLHFAPGIVDELVKSVLGRDTALPLLQFALQLLWEHRDRNRVTREVYAKIGGSPLVALERFADSFYESLPLEQQTEVKRILLELVRIDRMLEPYRQPRLLKELIETGNPRTEKVIDLLKSEHFIRVTPSTAGGEATVEVQHEALLRNWPRYLDWINEKRERVRQRIALYEAAQRWDDHGRSHSEGLLSGWQLDEMQQLHELSPLEQEYVQASIDAADSRRRAREQAILRSARTRYLVVALAVVAGLLFVAIVQWYQALLAKKEAEQAFEETSTLANKIVFDVVKDVDLRGSLPSTIVRNISRSAEEAYNSIIGHDPQNAAAYNGRGSAYLATNDFDRAIADFKQAIRLDPENASYYNNRGTAYRVAIMTELALDDFNKSLSLDPEDPTAWYGRCLTFAIRGEFDKALDDCNESLRRGPRQASALQARGFAYQNLGRLDAAIADFTNAIALNPRSWKGYENRGDAYRLKGDIDQAIQDFDHAIGLNPEDLQSYFRRGLAWRTKGMDDRAAEDYTKVLQLDPTQDVARAARCFSRAIAGLLEAALADCNESLKVRPRNAGTLDSRGLIYLKLGQFDNAIADYDAALGIDPQHASAFYGRGVAKLKAGDATAGESDIATAKTIRPSISDEFARYGVQ
jgi:tetratricopeptide (TPR) repeat protein